MNFGPGSGPRRHPPGSQLLALVVSQQVDVALLRGNDGGSVARRYHGDGDILVVQGGHLPRGRHTLLPVGVQQVTWVG